MVSLFFPCDIEGKKVKLIETKCIKVVARKVSGGEGV